MTEKKQLLTAAIILPAAAFLFVSVLIHPAECALCVGETVKNLCEKVLPILFPFMTISGILTGLRITRLFENTAGRFFPTFYKLPRSVAVAFLLGALCSYPIGTLTVTELYRKGELSIDEAERGAALASVTGPAFPVATVGALLLGNPRTGWLIYSVHILVPLVLGIPFCKTLCKQEIGLLSKNKESVQKGFISVVTEAISSASIRCITVCGTVTFFSLLCDRLIRVTGVTGTAAAMICSLFEFSEGCRRAAVLPGAAGAALCSFAISFGGFSIIAQSAGSMEKEGLSAVKLSVFKLICGAVSGTVIFLIVSCFDLFEPNVAAVQVLSYFEIPSAFPFVTLTAVSAGVGIRIRHLILKKY